MSNPNQFYLPLRNAIILGFTSAMLCACGSDKVDLQSHKSVHDAVDAATGPLEDLNIKKRDIPELLATAALNPYARPAKAKCAAVKEELAKLDALLGEDMKPQTVSLISGDDDPLELGNTLDDVKMPTTEQVTDGAGSMIKGRILGAIRSQTDIIPFRSIVRTVTGADRHQKKVETAYEAGKLRRAYLKGYAQERFGPRCLAPAVVVEAKAVSTAKSPTPEAPTTDPNEAGSDSDE